MLWFVDLTGLQQMVLFWLAQEAGVTATFSDNGAATGRVEKGAESHGA